MPKKWINLIITLKNKTNIHLNFFSSFIWDMTRWNRADIKMATGGNQTKVWEFILHFEQIQQPWQTNTICITIDWTSPHPIISGEMIWHDKSVVTCTIIVNAKGATFVSKCKQKFCTFVWFFPRGDLNYPTDFSVSCFKWKKTKFWSNLWFIIFNFSRVLKLEIIDYNLINN